MRGSPQFSFWIPIALAKICMLFSHSHKPRKNTLVLEGTVLNRHSRDLDLNATYTGFFLLHVLSQETLSCLIKYLIPECLYLK